MTESHPVGALILGGALLFTSLGEFSSAQWTRHTIDNTSRGADGIRVADVNGDRQPDLVTGWEEGGEIRIYLHPGVEAVRSPWPTIPVGRVESPEDAAFVDLDGDGRLDVVSSCEGRNRTVYFHWAPKEDDWDEPESWRAEALPAGQGLQMWMYCLPFDVDRREGMDLICGSKEEDGSVGWFQSPGDPHALDQWRWHPLLKAGWIMSLISADMDGDGDFDLLLSDRKGPTRGVRWLKISAESASPERGHLIGGADREVMFIDNGDLDGDGLEDVAAAAKDASLLFFRRRSPSGLEWETHEIAMPADAGSGKSVRIADLDRDGRQDLVVSCEHSLGLHGVFWLRAASSFFDPDRSFFPISGKVEGVKFDLIQLLDLDRDGDLDVLTCEETENLGVIWYENPGPERSRNEP